MGADIHMYAEYRNKNQAQEDQKQGRKPYWYCYGDQINPGRNYTLFGILAGVRGQYEDSFEPKGCLKKTKWDSWQNMMLTCSLSINQEKRSMRKVVVPKRMQKDGHSMVVGSSKINGLNTQTGIHIVG